MQLDDAYAELKIVQDFIPANNSNRPGTRLIPQFITIHNTDNDSPGANAAAHARYLKGQEARKRKVSWHFTVDDKNVYQSLPTNEVGWHAASSKGNALSIGIEICMHPEMDEIVAYKKAALLVAVMSRRLEIEVAGGVVQHHHWSGKNCPSVLRATPKGWENFWKSAADAAVALQDPIASDILAPSDHDHGIDYGNTLPNVLFTERAVVNSKSGLRLRAGPGSDFNVIASLPLGMPVTVISRYGDWSMVDVDGHGLSGSGDGFVHSAFLKAA